MAILLAATVLAFAPVMGADHPTTPVYNEGWSKGVTALVNGKNRVHGYFVNWTDVFFFKGDAKSFNAFLKAYGAISGQRRRLIIHTGKLEVRSPWDKKPRSLKANWRLVTNSVKPVRPTLVEIDTEPEVLDLWLSKEITDRKLVVPRNIRVERAKD